MTSKRVSVQERVRALQGPNRENDTEDDDHYHHNEPEQDVQSEKYFNSSEGQIEVEESRRTIRSRQSRSRRWYCRRLVGRSQLHE